MLRRMAALAIVAVALLTVATLDSPVTHADQRNFTLTNGSQIVIVDAYVTASSQTDWGDDILGVDVLLPDESADVLFSRYDGEAGVCLYDILVRGKDGEEGYLYGVDLCNTTSVTFR